MAARSLPTIAQADVRSKTTEKCCYVTIGVNIYDVTDFLEDHPGGEELILKYAGQDVEEIMKDVAAHPHSSVAFEILDEDYLIGYMATDEVMDAMTESNQPDAIVPLPPATEGLDELKSDGVNVHSASNGEVATRPIYAATGMSSAEDLSKETDVATDFKTHNFLDLSKPLIPQVWNGGFSKDFYLEQVHRPRHYKGGASAPLFGNFLEPLTKTPWWVIPSVWLPCVAYGTYTASQGLGGPFEVASYWTLGLAIWTLVEYTLHRCLFHIENALPDNRVGITLHFLLHGIHHFLPMDKYRLVMPPTLFVVLATPFWYLVHALFSYNWYAATAIYSGGIFGYVCYDLTHYFLHHRNLPAYFRDLKKYHLAHHFADYSLGYGVTSRIWDKVFGTELELPPPKLIKTS